ncbi:MAG: bifunctional nuclease family protein [Parabacteroides sp.]|nr:bifunctional nuclease family protein [Parabacteroides sp.]
MDKKIRLHVQGLTNSQVQSGAYALILSEQPGMRRIPIIVGTAEAQSIAIALEHIKPPRPLTHDLFVSFAQTLGIDILGVFIYKFEDGVFYSEVVFDDAGKELRLDSRTSDAIAIALRVGCEIYTTPEIVDECGVVLEDSQSEVEEENSEEDNLLSLEPEDIHDDKKLKQWLSLQEDEELTERLEQAIASEKYEFAKMYKDEIHRREENKESKAE